MSDQIKHECGIALIRLLKPLEHYQQQYGSALYGLNKLYLLMEKQRNRGQDGAGLATIKLDMPPGKRYISRHRSNKREAIRKIFDHIYNDYFNNLPSDKLADAAWLKANRPYLGELLLGHLRYGTHGANTVESCHPFLRQNNWISRNLVLAGNFNLTNVDELIEELVELGQYPKEKTDTVTVLEKIGHFLDDEVQRLFDWHKRDGLSNIEINQHIFEALDVRRILERACKKFDGGYVMAGMIGFGDAFVMRDPNGIRPAFYYQDEEVVVVASERPAIQTAFDVRFAQIKELSPGHALIIKKNGRVSEEQFAEPLQRASCSFESIYFSRGTDRDIYTQRNRLGEHLAPVVLETIGHDLMNTVFAFVPNTAETAFLGLMQGIDAACNRIKKDKILAAGGQMSESQLTELLAQRPRVEKLVVKDAKLRTFIADDSLRHDLVSHVYDVTYGIVQDGEDTLVLLDDSIVRGTTLRDSIVSIVSRLRPKRVVIVSSAPQIRYPDCYGIDMSKMGEFVAFKALVELLKEDGKTHLLQMAYERCKEQENMPIEEISNQVIPLYAHYSYEKISEKIAEIVTPPEVDCEVRVVFQTLEGLHAACPGDYGDWYFSGNYPTPGGKRVVNRAFMNYMERKNERAY
jgi:amidophosphoribosyltransferase